MSERFWLGVLLFGVLVIFIIGVVYLNKLGYLGV